MKFRVTMKDPDTLIDAVADAVAMDVAKLHLPEEEQQAIAAMREEQVLTLAARWFKYQEYLTVEIDTDAKTCVLLPA